MKSLRLFCLVALAPFGLAANMLAQSPAITAVTVKDTAKVLPAITPSVAPLNRAASHRG